MFPPRLDGDSFAGSQTAGGSALPLDRAGPSGIGRQTTSSQMDTQAEASQSSVIDMSTIERPTTERSTTEDRRRRRAAHDIDEQDLEVADNMQNSVAVLISYV